MTSGETQDVIEALQREVAQLRNQLQLQGSLATTGNETVPEPDLAIAETRRRKTPRRMDPPVSNHVPSPAVSLSEESEKQDPKVSTYIIRHMGRLVTDDSKIGKFAGSTTGVHFVSSVEEVCRRREPSIEPFHDDCFRLHLLQPRLRSGNSPLDPQSNPFLPTDDAFIQQLETLLSQPLESHMRRLDTFLESWLSFCPVIPRQSFLRCIEQLPSFDRASLSQWHQGKISATLHTLLLIGLINKTTGNHALENEVLEIWTNPQLLTFIHQLQGSIIAHGDTWCLQSLIVFSFFLQISGRSIEMLKTNGTLVRIAQSLGLHRHSRRFRFGQSENEVRNRMWWWIYGFDQ